MRDIKDYTEKYKDEPFEDTMVAIRKKTVIRECQKYPHANILEIGCGVKPFFFDFPDFENMVIAEPGESFVNEARRLVREKGTNGKQIHIFQGFLEDCVNDIKALGIEFDFIILY